MDSPAQQVKDKLNIVDIVGQYVQLRRAGRTYMARCPFHKEKTASFHVSPERGTYKCFGCGEGGDIFTFVEKIEGIDFPTALRQLAERAGVKLEQRFIPNPEHKEKDEALREVCEEATAFFETTLKERKDVLEYLHSRGVQDETITTWRIGYAAANWSDLSAHLVGRGYKKEDIAEAGLAVTSERKPGEIYDRFRGRIMFPIADANGRVIAFSGRFFEKVEGSREEGEPAKYVNSPETPLFKKSKALFGLHHAKNAIRKADCILMVEGQFDVVMSHQSGLPFTVAISGTALTPEHLTLLSRLSKRLVLALDADEAGVRAGLRSAHMALAAGFDVKVPAFPPEKDPADIARENPELLKAAIRTSRTAIEFFLDTVRPHAKDERAYKKLVETQILPLIAAIGSKIDQEHFIRIVAGKIGVSEAAVREEVAKRPVSTEASVTHETPNPQMESIERTPLEKAITMIALRYQPGTSERVKLATVIDDVRVKEITDKFVLDSERFLFEFDSLGEDEAAVAQGLIESIERRVIYEKITALQQEIKSKEGSAQGELLRQLSSLKRREEELRQ
jgi:DNA primase